MQLDIEKALDEQLLFEAFRTRKLRPRKHQRLADPERRGAVTLGIVILAQFSNSPWAGALAEPLQVAMDNGARKALIPLENKRNFLEVSGEIVERVDLVFSPIQ